MSLAQTFDFSSVGDTLPTLREHEKSGAEVTAKVKYGPATPLRLSNDKTELFVMNTNLADMVRDNLINLLLTNRGERIMQPDFGANLKPILTEFGTVGFESEVMSRIKASVSKFFPYISLSQMSLQQEDSPPDSGLVIVSVGITYSIPQVNATNQSVQVTLNTVA